MNRSEGITSELMRIIDAKIAKPLPLDQAMEVLENVREEIYIRLQAMREDYAKSRQHTTNTSHDA